MRRISVVGVLGLMGLFAWPAIFGQSTPAQAPSQIRDRRLDQALTEIELLKRQVQDQDRRIADLDKSLRTLQQSAGIAVVDGKVKVAPKPVAAPWQNPLAWAQVQEGMSRAQVEEILGKPTSVDSVIDYQSVTYKGEGPSGGVLTGSVKLTDDRVTAVTPPDF